MSPSGGSRDGRVAALLAALVSFQVAVAATPRDDVAFPYASRLEASPALASVSGSSPTFRLGRALAQAETCLASEKWNGVQCESCVANTQDCCAAGTQWNSTVSTCQSCPVGFYSTGSFATCSFDDVFLNCSSVFSGVNWFKNDYGTILGDALTETNLAARCDFGADESAMFIDRVTVKCQFSETVSYDGGPFNCDTDAAIDENNVTTFTLACAETELVSVLTFGNSLAFPFSSGSSEDIGETTCVPALRDGAAVTCAWEGEQTACVACPAGTLCAAEGTAEPTPCILGHGCSGGVVTAACATGQYSNRESGGVCAPCPAGKKCPTEATGFPEACPAGTYSYAGASQCEECPAGNRCNGNGGEGTAEPIACPAGLYAPAGSSSCAQCLAGETSSGGSESCDACPAGYYCPNAATSTPTECVPGEFSSAGASSCTDCEPGEYQDEYRQSTCKVCGAGTKCPFSGMKIPTDCVDGEYSGFDLVPDAFNTTLAPYDHRRSVTEVGRDTMCRKCPDGYRCPAPDEPPELCPPGSVRVGDNHTHCILCPAGSACPTPNLEPAPCADGAFAVGNATACTTCDAGYSCPSTNSSLQLRCASGTYAVAGSANCTMCDAGKECPNPDGTGIDDCVPGEFAEAGQVKCTKCPPGFSCPSLTDPSAMRLCDKGTYSVGALEACVVCPKGTYNPNNGSAALSDCAFCPRGYYSNFTGAVSEDTCLMCPQDTYCPDLGTHLPVSCGVGNSTFGRLARTSADDCTPPPPPPPPPSPPPPPASPPPPPTPPALAPGADATPTMTVRLDGTVAAFDEGLFKTAVADAVSGAEAADVVVEAVTATSRKRRSLLQASGVAVDFYVDTPDLYPVALGGAWNVTETARVTSELNAAIGDPVSSLSAGFTVLSTAIETECPPGTAVVSVGGVSTCETCATGTFSAETDANACTPCAVGSAAKSRGMSSCEICAAGSAAPSAGMANCAKCAPGTIQPDRGQGSCSPCDDFFFAALEGSTACEPCPAGYLSGPTAWVGETARMRADGRLSDTVGGAVNRSGCIPNATTWVFVPDPPEVFSDELTLTHLFVALATLLVTLAAMTKLGYGHWNRQKLLLKYAGGDSFFDAFVPEDEEADRRGMDQRTERADVLGIAEAIKGGDIEDAELVIGRVLERDPEQVETLHAKAVVHTIYGELDEAREYVVKALTHHKKPQFNNTRGVIHLRAGDAVKAAGEFELAIRRDPTLAVAYSNLGIARMQVDDLEGAKEALTTALDKEPEYYKAMYNLALVSMKMGRVADAKHWFRSGIAAKHRTLDAHFNLGMIFLREGAVQDAETEFKRCLAINAKHAPSLVKLGNLQMTRGHPKRAVEQYLLALEIDPDAVEAIANIGVVEWSRAHAVEAEQHFVLALKFERKYYPALYNMGLLCMEQGRVDEAADWYRRALATKPASKAALFQLGTALRALGQLEGQTPRAEEKSATEKAIAASEAEREAEEAAAKVQEDIAAALRAEKKSGGGAEAFADERKWSRLVLVSSKVKGANALVRAALSKTGVVLYDHRSSTLGTLLAQCRKKISTAEGPKRVDSVAFVTPSKEGKVSLVKGAGLTLESLLDADVAAFLEGMVSMINLDANAYREASRMDFLLLDATIKANDALASEIQNACGLRQVTASIAMARPESYALTEEQIKMAPTASGARSVAMYFDMKKLKPWAKLPDDPLRHPAPPGEAEADPVVRRKKTRAEETAERAAVQIAANVTNKIKTVGRAYAAYFRRRAQAGGGDVTGGEAPGDGEKDEDENGDEARWSSPGGASASGAFGSASASAHESALTEKGALALAGIHAPASAVLRADSAKSSGSDAGLSSFRRASRLVRTVARAGTTVREARAVTLDLLVEMDGEGFRSAKTQQYFVAEMASELGAHADRMRVTGHDTSTGAVTLRVEDKPGDVPLDVVVATLQVKLDSDTLLVDPSFGQIILTQVRWPEGWGEGKEKNSGIGGGLARSKAQAWEEGEAEEDDGGEEEGESGSEARAAAAFDDSPRRLVLISSRMLFADVLMESVEAGVIPVYFDWRFSSLEKIAHECAEKCGGESGLGALRSIGIMTHHKPGAIGLVKGCRATRRNLAKPEVRAFWVSLAKLLASDGRVDILGYDASRCVPTRKLLDELGELMRVPINTADAAAVTLRGDANATAPRGVDAAVLEAEDAFDAGSLYFSPRRFAAWAASAPERFTVGSSKYRGRAAARLASGSGAGAGAGEPRNASGLAPAEAAGGALGDFFGDDAFDLDPEAAARRRAARLAETREKTETRRELAMLLNNPAGLLKEVTSAGGAGGGGLLGVVESRARKPRVPSLSMDALVAARNDATGYDARLDRYALERAADARKSPEELAAEEANVRLEARLDDLSLVPNLGLASKNIGAGDVAPRGALATLGDGNAAPPPNARDAARRGLGARGFDRKAEDRSETEDRTSREGGEVSDEAPVEARAVAAFDPNDPNAPRAKPTWEMDENMRKLRRYENTGLGVVGDEYGRR